MNDQYEPYIPDTAELLETAKLFLDDARGHSGYPSQHMRHVANWILATVRKDDDKLVDEEWLKTINWAPVGNTWYTNEEDCNTPMMFWVSVDQSLRVAALNDWKIPEVTRKKFREVHEALVGPLNFPGEK